VCAGGLLLHTSLWMLNKTLNFTISKQNSDYLTPNLFSNFLILINGNLLLSRPKILEFLYFVPKINESFDNFSHTYLGWVQLFLAGLNAIACSTLYAKLSKQNAL
jgi:hypothetical protein